MTTQRPITEVRPFGNETIIPVGKYASLAIRKLGDQFIFVFADEEGLYLVLCPDREISGSILVGTEVTSVLVSNEPDEWRAYKNEKLFVFGESTSGYVVQKTEVDADVHSAMRTAVPFPVICTFVKDAQPMLILKSKSGRFLLKEFSLTRLNKAGWDSAIANDGTKQYVFEISQHGEIECIHHPE